MTETSSEMRSRPTVLVVDDDPETADLYAEWLATDYDVDTAYSGADALDLIDDSTDVVLVDRRMPGLTGDEVLAEIRSRGLTCRVALVTAVDPDFDIVDVELDDYLTKPVSRTVLTATVERLVLRSTYGKRVRRYFGLVSKQTLLDAEKSSAERDASDEYARLERERIDLRRRLDATVDQLAPGAFGALLRGRSAADTTDAVHRQG